jgi:hypothetical protein
MEGGALFDPGFLGGQFLWWIGQIPDDATWRDNINPGKYPEKDAQRGWGRRYKVRIIGIHDKDEETIPSDQLPWANIMYPVTAGSGAANAWQTPQIRQGNFVFGFWMDGPDQQVPVIMGILGNNQQTKLSTKVGTSKDNFCAASGFAETQDRPVDNAVPTVPDNDKTIVKPKSAELQEEEANHNPPDTVLNQFGLRRDKEQTLAQLKDIQSAKAAAEAAGLNAADALEKIKEGVAAGRKARLAKANSPLSDPEPGATLEAGASAPHITDASALVQDDLYKTKTVLLKPDNIVESSQKAIQTELDNLADKTKRHLDKMSEYSIAVSNKIPDMSPEIEAAAEAIAGYEKISVDKMMEFSLKSLNAKAAASVADLPSSARFQFADVKEGFTKKLAEEYLGITDGLADSIKGVLLESLDLANKEKAAQEAAKSLPKDKPETYADVAICTSEELIGKTVALARPKIDKANNNMLNNMNMFLDDITSSMAGITDTLGSIKNQIPDIEGSITSALQFTNASSLPNIFPFQMPPVPSVSDFYTMAEGSGAQPDAATPSPMAIGDIASGALPDIPLPAKIPFAEPSKDLGLVDLVKDKVMSEVSLEGALDAAAQVSPQAAAAKAAINIAQGQDPKDAAREAASDIYGV